MIFNFLQRAGFVLLLFSTIGTLRATAGPVYLEMVLDPATTAGAGIPTVNRANSTGTFSVTSNKSGPGSFHVYALDDTTGSFGISFFKVAFTGGAVTNVFNRSPIGSFNTLDDQNEILSDGSGTAGFSDLLYRSGGINPTTPLQGAQNIASPYRIGGLGQTARNLNNTPNMPPVPFEGTRPWTGVTSGQWGDYATDPFNVTSNRKWLFLGEGNYTVGAYPQIDPGQGTTVFYYSASDLNSQTQASLSTYCLDCGPTVSSQVFNNVNASDPGSLTYTFAAFNQPTSWSGFKYVSGPTPAVPASFDPTTQKFSWNSVGSPIGSYKWSVNASNSWGGGTGFVTVNVTVPEPATLTLFGLAIFAALLYRRPQLRRMKETYE